MPRDGSGVYTKPFPSVVDGTTIESAVHNGEMNDLAFDLNAPRPIVAGGTGANNAHDALINLHGEESYQGPVTNYDTFPFVSGSFASYPGATTAPDGATSANYFSGTAQVMIAGSSDWINLEARINDGTGLWYSRQKLNGTWYAWKQQAGSIADLDAAYVNVTGDTMTGQLNITNYLNVSNAITAGATGGTGVYNFGNTGTRSLTYDGTNFHLTSGHLFVDGSIFAVQSPTTGSFQFGSSATKWLSYDGTVFNLNGGALVTSDGSYIKCGYGYTCRSGVASVYGPNFFNFQYSGGAFIAFIDATNIGTVTLTSDYRIKKDVIDLPGMWDTVKALRPIKYTQAQFSPPSHVDYVKEAQTKEGEAIIPGHLYEADDIERWGFIAHELQETLTPSAASGVKDSPDTIQSPNPFTLIAALTKALQEAMARIEALEGA